MTDWVIIDDPVPEQHNYEDDEEPLYEFEWDSADDDVYELIGDLRANATG